VTEQLEGRLAVARPAQSHSGDAPLLQGQQIERALDHADTASIAIGLIPTQQRLGTR
jgi:hypothetical protein